MADRTAEIRKHANQTYQDFRLILASNSPRRRELLRQIHLDFEVIPSDAEERITARVPSEVVQELSRQKAENVAMRVSLCPSEILRPKFAAENDNSAHKTGRTVILGADTIVACGEDILGKPGTEEKAVQMIRELQNRSHEVYTGVTLLEVVPGGNGAANRIIREDTGFVCTRVHVLPMSDEEIREYVKTGDPLDKAGAYGIQGMFARYIDRIDGDYSNVVGLPVSYVYHKLRNF